MMADQVQAIETGRLPGPTLYTFKSKSLLAEALTHKSYSVEKNKDKAHNERLEFLGDSLLNCIIACRLVELFPEDAEGTLSKKRASLVNQQALHGLALKMDLGSQILFGPGEIKQGSATNPRILASAYEALVGALFLDSDFLTTQKWVLETFKEVSFDRLDNETQAFDYKTRLQEWAQKKGLAVPTYELVHSSGPSHKPQFIVALKIGEQELTRAEAGAKKAAEQKAAEIYYTEMMKLENEVKS